MNVVITESQYLQILRENQENEIEQTFSNSKEFAKKIVSDAKKQYGIDFSFLTTWGSVIGGFVGPITNYMEGKYPNLSETDITLISFGIILTFFSSNKEKLNKVLQIIKDKKLVTFFDRALMKSYDLRDALVGFLESLNVTFSKVSNMVAYTFLIPLMPLLKDISEMDLDQKQIEFIAMGISHYTGGIIASNLLSTVVKKIIKRFKS
jgi:hypothetical protein